MTINSIATKPRPEVLANSIIQERISRSIRIEKERVKLCLMTYDT